MSRFNDSQFLFTFAGFRLLLAYLVIAAMLLCRRPDMWLRLFAIFLGLLAGFVDLQSHEPQLPALLLVASSFFVSVARPRHAWEWALLIGLWVPVASVARAAAGFGIVPHTFTAFIALVPAFFGAYAGVLVAWFGTRFQPQNNERNAFPNL